MIRSNIRITGLASSIALMMVMGGSGCGWLTDYDSATLIENPKPRISEEEALARVAISDEDIAKYGREVAENLNQGKHRSLLDTFDNANFYKRAFGARLSSMENKDVGGYFIQKHVTVLMEDTMFTMLNSVRASDIEYSYHELLDGEATYNIILRRSSDWFFDYFILTCRVDPAGRFYLIDVAETALLGQPLSEFCSTFYMRVLDAINELDPETITKRDGMSNPEVQGIVIQLINYDKIRQLAGGGDFQKALAAFYLLDNEVSDQYYAQRTLFGMLSAAGGNQVDIKRTVDRLDRKWPNTLGSQYTLLEHYYFERNLPKTLEQIDLISKRFNEDPAWDITRGFTLGRNKAHNDALKLLIGRKEQLKLLSNFYFALSGAQVGLNNFAAAAETLTEAEQVFEQDISEDMISGYDWAETFGESAEGKAFFSAPYP